MSTSIKIPLWPEVPSRDKSSVHALHAQLLFTQWMEPDRFLHYQLLQLEDLLRLAGGHSNYHAPNLTFMENLPPGGLYAEHLSLIPVMSCADLQQSSQKIIVRMRLANHGRSRMLRISKSEGSPIKMMVTGLVDAWKNALVLRSLDWHESDTTAACLRMLQNTSKQKSGSAERCSVLQWSGPLHTVSVDHPSLNLVEELLRINPGSLLTEPQILKRLLEQAASRDVRPGNLLEIRCRGQSLDPAVSESVEKIWGVPVIHEYYLDEIGVIALQCPEHQGLHINSEFVYVEILNDNDEPCKAGQIGRVVVTPLQNFQTPLIRYDTGNLAEVGEPCACGRTLPVLKRILD